MRKLINNNFSFSKTLLSNHLISIPYLFILGLNVAMYSAMPHQSQGDPDNMNTLVHNCPSAISPGIVQHQHWVGFKFRFMAEDIGLERDSYKISQLCPIPS